MTTRSVSFSVLRQLYWLASVGKRPSVRLLAERTGISLRSAAEAVSWLDGQGLVDAGRLRLTLAGLAVAVSSCARSQKSAA